jgi:hypothetical protein
MTSRKKSTKGADYLPFLKEKAPGSKAKSRRTGTAT